MTNAEKYLKPDMKVAMWKGYNQTGQKCKSIWQWLDQEAKPTLTEDERVILRNASMRENGKHIIKRDTSGRLFIEDEWSGVGWSFWCFNHLFQFIKNGEEYSIEELLKGE